MKKFLVDSPWSFVFYSFSETYTTHQTTGTTFFYGLVTLKELIDECCHVTDVDVAITVNIG